MSFEKRKDTCSMILYELYTKFAPWTYITVSDPVHLPQHLLNWINQRRTLTQEGNEHNCELRGTAPNGKIKKVVEPENRTISPLMNSFDNTPCGNGWLIYAVVRDPLRFRCSDCPHQGYTGLEQRRLSYCRFQLNVAICWIYWGNSGSTMQ